MTNRTPTRDTDRTTDTATETTTEPTAETTADAAVDPAAAAEAAGPTDAGRGRAPAGAACPAGSAGGADGSGGSGGGDCVGLEEALRLSTDFSLHSGAGGVPETLLIPIPSSNVCEFVLKPWRDLDEREREAFRRFYTRVGGRLEDVADLLRGGRDLDEVAWREITASLGARD